MIPTAVSYHRCIRLGQLVIIFEPFNSDFDFQPNVLHDIQSHGQDGMKSIAGLYFQLIQTSCGVKQQEKNWQLLFDRIRQWTVVQQPDFGRFLLNSDIFMNKKLEKCLNELLRWSSPALIIDQPWMIHQYGEKKVNNWQTLYSISMVSHPIQCTNIAFTPKCRM